MKDSEFIELLNLYLDHEISAADAARLEAEVQSNPARRRIYQDYCRMQKACKVLAEEFQSESVVVPEPAFISRQAVERRARLGNFYTVGAFAAAAACVAIIFVGRNREQAADARRNEMAADAARPVAVQPATAVAVNPSKPQAIAQTVSAPNAGQGPLLLGNQLLLSRKAQPDTTMRPAADQAGAQFAWMDQIQLAPIQPVPGANLRFDTPSSTLRTEPRTYNNRQQPVDASVEMTAFRFQR